jgi:cytochrome bd-I ubiquinol oxidase subunit X
MKAIEKGTLAMWYFSWVLGLGFAVAFAVLNAIWLELTDESNQPPKQ